MDDKWVKRRLEDALGADSEHLGAVMEGLGTDDVGKRLVQVDRDFNVRQFELDANANKGREL